MVEENIVELGAEYDVKVISKGARDEGIGKVGDWIIFIKNAKTRIGNIYRIKVTKLYRTFAYGEPVDKSRTFVGSGSMVEFA